MTGYNCDDTMCPCAYETPNCGIGSHCVTPNNSWVHVGNEPRFCLPYTTGDRIFQGYAPRIVECASHRTCAHLDVMQISLICNLSGSAVCFASPSSDRFLIALGTGLVAAVAPWSVYFEGYEEAAWVKETVGYYVENSIVLNAGFTATVALGATSTVVGALGASIQALVNQGETADQVLLYAVEQVQAVAKNSYGNGTAIMESYGWMP